MSPGCIRLPAIEATTSMHNAIKTKVMPTIQTVINIGHKNIKCDTQNTETVAQFQQQS